MKSNKLQNKVIIVAGGAGGIGSAISRLLAEHGATIIVANRLNDRILPLTNHLLATNPTSRSVTADLATFRDWSDVVRTVEEKYRRIDVLVNCVGIVAPGAFNDIIDEQIEQVILTNIGSVAYGIKAVLPLMKQQRNGHIINLGSLGGIVPMPFGALYSATKFAVRGFSLSLHEELRSQGIFVTLISPGPVRTKMLDLEATDDRSTVTFVNKPLETVAIASAVFSAILRPRREIVLPPITGKLSFVFGLFPNLFGACFPILNVIGGRGLKKFRKYSGRETGLISQRG